MRPWARITANSRPRSSSRAASAARMPRKATAIASRRSTPVMRKVRSKISTDIRFSSPARLRGELPFGRGALDRRLELLEVGAGFGEDREHSDSGLAEMGAKGVHPEHDDALVGAVVVVDSGDPEGLAPIRGRELEAVAEMEVAAIGERLGEDRGVGADRTAARRSRDRPPSSAWPRGSGGRDRCRPPAPGSAPGLSIWVMRRVLMRSTPGRARMRSTASGEMRRCARLGTWVGVLT